MTTSTSFSKDGSISHGTVHPEIAESSLACLKRDLRRLRQTNNKPFIRRPYADLQEAQLIAINPDAPAADLIVGIVVIPLVKGDTNARIPFTVEQVKKELAKGDVIDFWTPKGFS